MSKQLKIVSKVTNYKYILTPTQAKAAEGLASENPYPSVGRKLTWEITDLVKNAQADIDMFESNIYFSCAEGQTDSIVEMIERSLGEPNE